MDLVRLGVRIFDLDPSDPCDPRTKDWFTVRTPYPLMVLISLYLYLVLIWGPRFMKDREAYDLKTFIKGYNTYQIIANAAIVYYTIKFGLFSDIPLTCVPMNYSFDGKPMKMAVLFWYIWLSKTTDFLETFMFILRKKNKQISFLHLYHHVSTMVLCWTVLKVLPGGVLTVHMCLNSFIHVVMYSYYLASAFGPEIQRKISPFKRYVTIMQMIQFVFLLWHTWQAYNPECNIPLYGVNVLLGNFVLNFILFFNFYRKAYWKPKSKAS